MTSVWRVPIVNFDASEDYGVIDMAKKSIVVVIVAVEFELRRRPE